MAVTIRDPNIRYNGKTLPKDKAPARENPQDPNIPYNGKTLPADKVPPVAFKDAFNTPGYVLLQSETSQLVLPMDTKITVQGEKNIVKTPILDADNPGQAVVVFERIQRKPYKIEMEGVFRMQNRGGTNYSSLTPPSGTTGQINNVFAQDVLNDFWNNAWLLDTVMIVKNSYLNGLGIQQLVIEDVSPELVRGSTNIPFKITAWENVPGGSLIIT